MTTVRKSALSGRIFEESFQAGAINERERALLITSLLYAMDKIANTCGHYDAYIQGAAYEKSLELCVPAAQVNNNPRNRCLNMDANKLVRELKADLVYIDPPYNSRQYCDAYHVLENVARWEKPAGPRGGPQNGQEQAEKRLLHQKRHPGLPGAD